MTVAKKITTASAVVAGPSVIAAINDRINRVETATLGVSTFTLAGTSDTLTAAEFEDGGVILLAGSPSGNFTLTVPGSSERLVTIINTTSVEVTVTIASQSATPPTFPLKSGSTDHIGQSAMIRSNGTNVYWAVMPNFALSDAEYAALSTVDSRALYTTI